MSDMFSVVGEGSYDPSTDSLVMRRTDNRDDNLSDIMTVDDIVDYVNTSLSYKPDWAFNAHVVRSATGDYVSVFWEAIVTDSDPRYRGMRAINDGYFALFAGTREHVQVQLLHEIMRIEAHETSEFLRFNGHAPFHAHRADGRERWASAQDVTSGLPGLWVQ